MRRGTRAWACAVALALIGAHVAAAFDFTVTRLDDPAPDACVPGDCSLREAVIAANALGGLDHVVLGAGVHQLSRPGAGEDLSATGDLDVTDDVVIEGAGSATTRTTSPSTASAAA
jgi:CSLREA domain-containing protein